MHDPTLLCTLYPPVLPVHEKLIKIKFKIKEVQLCKKRRRKK